MRLKGDPAPCPLVDDAGDASQKLDSLSPASVAPTIVAGPNIPYFIFARFFQFNYKTLEDVRSLLELFRKDRDELRGCTLYGTPISGGLIN